MRIITEAQWVTAQENERKQHEGTFPDYLTGFNHYHETYKQYFQYLGIDFDLKQKSIIEIGCADFPALAYCQNYGKSFIIEPLPGQHLLNYAQNNKDLMLITEKAEPLTFPKVDEVWLFNVLQHVKSPDKIIENCKKSAKVIRFFEPVNYGTDIMHLHNFTVAYFQAHFGDIVKYYPQNRGAKKFHSWECAYGVYETGKK